MDKHPLGVIQDYVGGTRPATPIGAPSRRDQIMKAVAKAEAGPPLSDKPGLNQMQQLDNVIREEAKHGRIAPGGMSKLLKNYLPPEHRERFGEIVKAAENQLDLGKHGNVQAVADIYGVDRQLLDTTMDCLETDYIAAKLQERKSDSDLSLPKLTRRDDIQAAFDVHAGDDHE